MPNVGKNVFLSSDIKIDDDVEIGNNVIISGKGEIKSGTKIGHGVIIEGNFEIGNNSIIDHHSVIRGNVKIGTDNWIYPFCTIGTGPQHLKFPEASSTIFSENHGKIIIGSNNNIREYTTIHLPTIEDNTIVGSNCYIMAYCHIAHDCIVSDNVIMANQTTLGGHVKIDKFANIGLNVSIHQFCRIGQFSMIGMGNIIVKDVMPFSLMINQKFIKTNKIGLQRNNVDDKDILGIENYYNNYGHSLDLEKKWYVESIEDFVQNSKRGIYSPEFDP